MTYLTRTALRSLVLAAALAAQPALALTFNASLDGLQQVPTNASTATGNATVTVTGDMLDVSESFTGLIGGAAAAAHIHCCASPGTNAGVALPFPNFPADTSDTYMHSFDLTDSTVYTSTFLSDAGGTAAAAEAMLIAGLEAGTAYVNIHNATFPGGEIRGNLVPEPSSFALLAAALAAAALGRARARG